MDLKTVQSGPVSVDIKVDTGKRASGQGHVVLPTGAARMKKAAAPGIAGLLCGIVTVAPPGPHSLVTGPLSIILSAIALYLFRIDAKLERVTANCPGCQVDIELEGGKLAEVMEDQCPKCMRRLELTPALVQAS